MLLTHVLYGGWISKRSIDSFYNLYAGGLPGLRGYSYYSMGGTNKAAGRISLRFPVWKGIDKRLSVFYLDRIHSSVFFETGNAWKGKLKLDEFKKDVGAELRMKLFSWYGYPTDIQFTTAYGLDRFDLTNENGEITNYGHKWRWYLTVLFDFI